MIVLENYSWLQMVFARRGGSLRTTWRRIAVVTVFAAFVSTVELSLGIESYSLTPMPFTLIGISMAIFLGFRNSASYDRFWEGRRLWGQLVNATRSLTRQTLTLVVAHPDGDPAEVAAFRRRFIRTLIACVHALRHHLRGTSPDSELSQYLTDEDRQAIDEHSNTPIVVLQLLGDQIHNAWQLRWIHEYHVPVFESSLTEITAVLGGCERIRNTPIPFSYNVLIHRIVTSYCLAMPFGLIETMGGLTPIAVCLIAYGFFGLDAIGCDVEQPFETDDNDLPLTAISRTIEINLLQLLKETSIPEPVQPVDGVLL